MLEAYSSELLWIVILAFIIAFILAFAVGANDVANSYGTSVGSGVLTFRQACYLATIFEVSGAILLGYKVADTMRKGILDVKMFEDEPVVLMYGMLSALIGSSCWLFMATFLRVPVSTTHSIVGATVGFGLVAHGFEGLNWNQLIQIAISWVASPVLSGFIGVVIYTLINKGIIQRNNPLRAGLLALPIIYGLTVFVNVLSVIFGGSKLLGLEKTPLWMALTISATAMILVAIIIQIFIVPKQKREVLNDLKASLTTNEKLENGIKPTTIATVESVSTLTTQQEKKEIVDYLFRFLQILSAVFTSFVHGGNDVGNSIGPIIAIWKIYTEATVLQKSEAPIWLLFYGGIGMVVGMWILGQRVNETVGKKITKITSTNGFTVESSAATTVLMASKLGIPLSTTHCIVGSVVFVGAVYGEEKNGKKVDWSLFRTIIYAWLVTLPIAGGISALSMWILMTLN